MRHAGLTALTPQTSPSVTRVEASPAKQPLCVVTWITCTFLRRRLKAAATHIQPGGACGAYCGRLCWRRQGEDVALGEAVSALEERDVARGGRHVFQLRVGAVRPQLALQAQVIKGGDQQPGVGGVGGAHGHEDVAVPVLDAVVHVSAAWQRDLQHRQTAGPGLAR